MSAEFSRFPAKVRYSDGRLIKKAAAVVVAGGRARVAEKQGGAVVVVTDRDDVTTIEAQPDRTTVVTFADGATIRCGKGEGCSCGSVLKSWFSQALREGG